MWLFGRWRRAGGAVIVIAGAGGSAANDDEIGVDHFETCRKRLCIPAGWCLRFRRQKVDPALRLASCPEGVHRDLLVPPAPFRAKSSAKSRALNEILTKRKPYWLMLRKPDRERAVFLCDLASEPASAGKGNPLLEPD
jgi:hypothetical protein